MSIPALAVIFRRELASRVNGGLEITLYWDVLENTTSIDIHQSATDETISVPVPAERALEAFHHPFVHLALRAEAHDLPPELANERN